ncbi:MAG: glycogen debranching protein GlgX [Deltaproteobacteria bacterium]|nr:glycogen debranching protein GlgX [Deltaproteobacteria bacterium]
MGAHPSLVHRTSKTLSAGRHWPLGATVYPDGVNFAVYSKHATEVFLQLFAPGSDEPTDVIRMPHRRQLVWHCFVHGVGGGQAYAYRVRGPFDPKNGHRFDEHKLLIDPYAKALSRKVDDRDNLTLSYDPASPERDLSFDERDSSPVVPRSIVVDDSGFDWQGDRPPSVQLEELVLYEVHLKGFTAHASSGVRHPGTYLGFVEKIPHLKALGVNAVELLPIHEIFVEGFLRERGLTNYWGYNTLSFFAPESSYAASREPGASVHEMKTLVRELHRAGIEVILDVVYNHSAEGSELGPTLSLRGIDNASYYALTGPPDQPRRYYMNWSGCGNSLDLANPPVLRLVMDSLRYWVSEMHVDGFRFDLASVLAREEGRFRIGSAFFDAVSQDPVLARVKLIAEPWDLGTYEVGNFPIDWSEWNGRFRDTVRRFVKGDAGVVPELAARVAGSADLYGDDGRSAYNSINFVTCHDGFTSWDLVSYDRKHNEANLESNRDGANDNHSWNVGVEGPSDDADVNRMRRRLAKNHICCLLFSSGTPMLLGGDEMLRTQLGNNNAYCQDNEISWFDWALADVNRQHVEFVRKAIGLLRRFPVLARRRFLSGRDSDGNELPDVLWFGVDGGQPDWGDPSLRTLCYQLDGSEAHAPAGHYRLFFVFHAHHELKGVRLPQLPDELRWHRVLDTSLEPGHDLLDAGAEVLLDPQDHYLVNARSTVVLLAR